MVNFGDYFSATENSNLSKDMKSEKESMNFKQDFKFREPSPDKGFYSAPPPNYNRSKHSYRASYPSSKREMQEYEATAPMYKDGSDTPSQSPSSSSASTPVDGRTGSQRSSLRPLAQPKRRKSSPPKRVRFNMIETIYEPFDARDSQTIDQIMMLLHLPSRAWYEPSIPPTSSYAVVARRAESPGHEYPEPVSPTRSGVSSVKSMRGIFVDGYPRITEPKPRPSRAPSIDRPRERLSHGNAYCGSEPHYQLRSGVCSPMRVSSCSESRSPLQSPTCLEAQTSLPICAETQRTKSRRYSGSQYDTNSQRQRQAFTRTESHSRPRARSVPPLSQSQAGSNRSSLETDETLVSPEVTWAPAAVMLGKQQAQAPEIVNEDEPLPVAGVASGNGLRRKDAQRLPAVPRRQKLLQNIARMF